MKLNNCLFCQKSDLEPTIGHCKMVYECGCGAKFSVIMLENEPFYSNASYDGKIFYSLLVRRVRKGLSILFDTSKIVRDNKSVATIAKRTTDGSLAISGALF